MHASQAEATSSVTILLQVFASHHGRLLQALEEFNYVSCDSAKSIHFDESDSFIILEKSESEYSQVVLIFMPL